MANIIVDVDLAKDVKDFILNSDDVDFSDTSLKTKIFSTDDDKLLRVIKTIDSPTKIISVDLVDDFFNE